MQPPASRRHFLKTGATAASSLAVLGLTAGSALAVEPLRRAGQPRLLLSLAAYSFRDYFREVNPGHEPKGAPAKRLDLFQFIDFCADHGCAGTELTSYYFPKELTTEFLVKLRRHAFLRGLAVSGTAVGNTFTHPPGTELSAEISHVKKWIDRAGVLGAPHIRVFAGPATQGVALAEAQKRCIGALEECADYAGQKGIFLGLENHGGIVEEPADLLAIVQAVKSPWVGVNLDTGNFHTDDPYAAIALCAPYAVNVQLKAEVRRRGGKDEPADFARLVSILRGANYQGFVALEYESSEDPWTAVPRLLQELKQRL